MDLIKIYGKSIQNWLIQNKWKCPICNAEATFQEVVSVEADRLHPDASSSKGIDTSKTATIAKIKCSKCNFDDSILVLDDIGIC
jgi:hypothetical protein